MVTLYKQGTENQEPKTQTDTTKEFVFEIERGKKYFLRNGIWIYLHSCRYWK